MKKLLLGATALTCFAGVAGPAYAQFTLTILHLNDFHSRFESVSSSDSTCTLEQDDAGECFGGIGRVKAAIDERRAALEGENVILLDAGDWFQGSLFYTTYRSAVVAEFTNDLGIDVMALGNHEFDDGPEELALLLDAIDYPLISGNTYVAEEPLLAGRIPGVYVLEVGGERIGIVSALAEDTDETSSPGDNVVFDDTIVSLRGQVAALEAAGIDKVIALTHIGFTQDQEIAAAVPGIDVIVGGHSHTVLSNTEENAAASYPFLVTGPGGVEVPIVTAGAYGRYLGELRVTWDDDGNVTEAAGDPLLLDASIAPYEPYAARIAELNEPIEELKQTVIGASTAPIDGSRETCRAVECEMGNFVADAILDRTADQGVQIVFQNGGGLRASIDAGEITMGEVLTVLPFSNTLATFQLSGAGVREALENGVSDVENGAGRFSQVAGLRYTYDPSLPAGSRITSVEVAANGGWEPLEDDTIYGIATNDYVRRGGDGYAVFEAEAIDPYDFGPPLEQVVADYVASLGGQYEPFLDGRITRVGD